ncbi:MAG: hypothetical protein CME70_18835 [Halobacteriovorax sp.]|nr:hypothetical protein [Halobacteriovorax sp.]
MKLNKEMLRELIMEEMNTLNEECPTGLPCPIAAASELKQAGASPEELLDWVAKLLQELLSPVERDDADQPADTLSAMPSDDLAISPMLDGMM